MKQDDTLLHHLLLTYLSKHYQLPGHEALAKFRQTSPAVATAINELLGKLYGERDEFSPAHRNTLISAALHLRTEKTSQHANGLPPLYPHMPQSL